MNPLSGSPKKLTRRDALRILGGLAASTYLSELPAVWVKAESSSKERPNVLILSTDDLNCHLGSYGHRIVKSPNIDGLARGGVQFSYAYCQFPLCNPSRTSWLTGLRPDTTRIMDNRTHFRDELPEVVTLPQLFRENGYFTANVGKIFHGGLNDPKAWDVIEQAGRAARQRRRQQPQERPRRRRAAQQARLIGNPIQWQAAEGSDEDQPDGRKAFAAIHILQNLPKKPFFLALGFNKPHAPYIAPKKYFNLYKPEELVLPKTPSDDWDDVPKAALTSKVPNLGMNEQEMREAIHAYYACISFVDAQIERVLEALEKAKLANDTIIIFISDNGYHIGEHGLWHKMTLFEESARVPLIISAPGMKRGATSQQLVEYVDIYPTLAELCSLRTPDNLEGVSLVPLLKNPNKTLKRAAFTQVRRARNMIGRSLRTERYRYTEWSDGQTTEAELYDHQVDSQEYHNLARSKEYSAVLKELSELLHKGWQAALV